VKASASTPPRAPLSASTAVEGALSVVRTAWLALEAQIRDTERAKLMHELAALRTENEQLKARPSAGLSFEAQKPTQALTARLALADSRVKQLEAELAAARQEQAQTASLCEELITKLEAATQAVASAPAPQ